MKTIFCPTDFSSDAENALRYGVSIADTLKAKIIVFHACHLPALVSQVPLEEITEERIIREANGQLNELMKLDFLRDKNVNITCTAAFGLAVDGIISGASKENADLIIMGTKGASGIEEIFLGSNASSVISKSVCPVLVVPAAARFNGFKKIIFATDYMDNDIQSITRLSEIASLFDAEILIVHMSDISRTDKMERDVFEKFQRDVVLAVPYKRINFQFRTGLHTADVLNEVVLENKAELLAMSTRRRNIFEKLFDLRDK